MEVDLSVWRVIDANANRAREAMRVLEEAARFVLDDADQSAHLKQLRHDFADACQALGRDLTLQASRRADSDVGCAITTDREMARGAVESVVTAAGKRLSEAFRCLEEYGKLVSVRFAGRIEKLRYRGYQLEKHLVLALGHGMTVQWRVCVLISEHLCRDGDWLKVAEHALAGGADCLQLREKQLSDAELLLRAKALVRLADRFREQGRHVSVVLNDRVDIALLAGVDGVHLGQSDLPVAEARRLVGRQMLVGLSTGSMTELEQAVADGADYVGLGPMYATATKPKDHIAGPEYVRQFVRWVDQRRSADPSWRSPGHLAIGGIDPDSIGPVLAAGARGVAVSRCVCDAADPGAVVRRLLAAPG